MASKMIFKKPESKEYRIIRIYIWMVFWKESLYISILLPPLFILSIPYALFVYALVARQRELIKKYLDMGFVLDKSFRGSRMIYTQWLSMPDLDLLNAKENPDK